MAKEVEHFNVCKKKIIKRTEDYSLLAWQKVNSIEGPSVIASSPDRFSRYGIWSPPLNQSCSYREIKSVFIHPKFAPDAHARVSILSTPSQMTARGLRIHTLVEHRLSLENSPVFLLWTGCMYKQLYLCIELKPTKRQVSQHMVDSTAGAV